MSSAVINCYQLSSDLLSAVRQLGHAWGSTEVFKGESLAWREDKGIADHALDSPVLGFRRVMNIREWCLMIIRWSLSHASDFSTQGSMVQHG